MAEIIHQARKNDRDDIRAVAIRDEAWLGLALLTAALIKIFLVLFDRVPFNSDEAIVGLMARHILQGARPVFFYGQSYMGSLDAWLVAGAFSIFGESVLSIRIVQIGLYLAFMATLWLLARRLVTDRRLATVVVWLAAIPGVLITTYTTASLGGYGESLLFGNLILLIGYEILYGKFQKAPGAWLAMGLVGGLAFWTLGMSGVYLLPVALIGLAQLQVRKIPLYGLAALGFFAGSSPWWYMNFLQSGAALQEITTGALARASLLEHLYGLVFIGLPALLGLRYPWSGTYVPIPYLFVGLLLSLGLAWFIFTSIRSRSLPLRPGGSGLLSLFIIIWLVVFIGTRFGLDATGRYLLPLSIPLFLAQASMVIAAWKMSRLTGRILFVALIVFQGFSTGIAAGTPERLTTQFNDITCFDNEYDHDLIEFLESQDETRGYSSYWVSFRIAFLSQEELIFAPLLPYKLDLSYSDHDNRIPGYKLEADGSARTAYITAKHPELDRQIRTRLDSLNVTYTEKQIGVYHIFYALSKPVRPVELGYGMSTPGIGRVIRTDRSAW